MDAQNWVLPQLPGARGAFSLGELLATESWKDVEHLRGSNDASRWNLAVSKSKCRWLELNDE